MTALIIHGHFYQPPRENPWTGEIEEQPTAAPFHDWNERVYAECYAPNASVPIVDPINGQKELINNYANISFNFGPTLIRWLETAHPETYSRILNADTDSITKRGHGNAIAQAYGHAILPLCNAEDLRTQIRWGLADFRYRFGRAAEALWLPETACNDSVLEALIDEKLRFVILAPHQAARIRPITTSENEDRAWSNVNEQTIDTGVPYRYSDSSRPQKSIAVFFYNGWASRAIAFEKLLSSSRELIQTFARSSIGRQMMNVATDGETYGHHFKFGDLCLAHALEIEAPTQGFRVTNYAEFLSKHSPAWEVKINSGPDGEGSSWSCIHGVGRWLRNCGCETGGRAGWNQKWRRPLRSALDLLRDQNREYFEATRGKLFLDPWQTRDDSIALLLDKIYSREKFLFEHAGRWLSYEEQERALAYLDLQHMLILMYTSCGWFFNDISGIESIQILKYAGRAIDLMEQLGLPFAREQFLSMLAEAESNLPERGTGADIYRREVEPLMGTQRR